MNENKFESVSALLDNDNVEQSLLDEVTQDDKLSDTWSRYHLIGDIMRGDSADFIDRDLDDERWHQRRERGRGDQNEPGQVSPAVGPQVMKDAITREGACRRGGRVEMQCAHVSL